MRDCMVPTADSIDYGASIVNLGLGGSSYSYCGRRASPPVFAQGGCAGAQAYTARWSSAVRPARLVPVAQRRRPGQVPETRWGLRVDGVDRGADHAAFQQSLVDVADQPIELLIGDPGQAPEVRVPARAANRDPVIVAPDEVGTDDHAVPVVLESLGRVDAAHLSEPRRVRRPQRRWRCSADCPVAPQVPRPGPVADDHVGHERPVRTRVAPWPAITGRHASPVAGVKTPLERLFQLMGTVGDLDFERRIAAPRDGAAGIKAQEPVNPLQAILPPATPQLCAESDPIVPQSPL